MTTNRYGILPNWQPDPQFDELKAIVDYSRKNPEKFKWQDHLNQWQVNFVVNILGVEQHTECFTPTVGQKVKVVGCLDKLTAAIVQHTESENNRSIQDNAN